jgi:hypothetical protein
MKKVLCLSFIMFLCLIIVNAQKYQKVKIVMKNGEKVSGTKAFIDNESISFKIGGSQSSYSLSDIYSIDGQKGTAEKLALGCGVGCFGVTAIYFIAGGTNEFGYSTVGTIGVVLLSTVVSAGLGYLIGYASDPYKHIYPLKISYLERIDFNFTTDQFTRYTPRTNNFTLSYRF